MSAADVQRYVWLLEKQGFLDHRMEGIASPTAELVEFYDSKQQQSLPHEQVFPKGTQYDAFKAIKNILSSGGTEVFIVDNYLDDSVLDMLSSLPSPTCHTHANGESAKGL